MEVFFKRYFETSCIAPCKTLKPKISEFHKVIQLIKKCNPKALNSFGGNQNFEEKNLKRTQFFLK